MNKSQSCPVETWMKWARRQMKAKGFDYKQMLDSGKAEAFYAGYRAGRKSRTDSAASGKD